jgi:hypothetical protein
VPRVRTPPSASASSRALRALIFLPVLGLASCGSDSTTSPAPLGPPVDPGEVCDATNTTPLKLVFDPPTVVVAPGQTRPVRVTIEPDACLGIDTTFTVDNAAVVAAPAKGTFDLRHATYDFTVTGGASGSAVIAAHAARTVATAESTADAKLTVEVQDPAIVACGASDKTPAANAGAEVTLSAGTPAAKGQAHLANASVSVVTTAFARDDVFVMPAVKTSVACSSTDLATVFSSTGGKVRAVSPPVTFTADAAFLQKPLRREIDFQIPVNPAAFPSAARMRHLVMLFTNPLRAKDPRPVPIANPKIEKVNGEYVLKFSAPWFGTYQAIVAEDAGQKHRKRHLTHRAVLGFSMGGGGAASFGARHHDQFDSIVPLGGPSDWNWMLWFVEKYALGGFCKANDPTCAKPKDTLSTPLDEPIAHPMDYNHWWYQEGNGNGGHFPRDEYVQIFEDLALMQGNPAGENQDPSLAHMAPGPKATDKWIVGDPTDMPAGANCSFTVEPIDKDPNQKLQQQLATQCRAARCKPDAIWTAPTNFFNADYNPDGSLPVISFCDGAQNGTSPYVDTWVQPTADNAVPMNLLLAVDKNKNGLRDQDEPVIVAGHEPWDDSGVDGLLSVNEPGYDAVKNPDPNQDDYDYQINPTGTEGNHRFDDGEPYKDYGLDGVPNTVLLNVAGDVGENDGKFTEAAGLKNFHKSDAHHILRGWTTPPGGQLTDDALKRFDVMSDGGVRDLFNFSVVANHLTGAMAARKGADGLPLRSLAYYNNFENLPGADPKQPNNYTPNVLRWSDIVDMPNIRYGTLDATPAQIENGDGQHVGTALQLLFRLETGFYYVAHRWPDADRRLTELTTENPATETINEQGIKCERAGKCEKIFTGPKTGRTGPIAVTLPPGYGLAENKGVRYPVLYVLHGYGQDPRDLEAVALITNNFMNAGERSSATRLPKFIVVYVDGRCRMATAANGKAGKPECIRGTFYLDSNRPDGPKMDQWFDEVITYVDQNYRTMGPADVDVTE